MIAAAVSVLLQSATPTVGDTIWVSRAVAVPSGQTVRAGDWHPADPIELLGPPRIRERGDSAEIIYAVVVWQAGTHVGEIPGPLLLGAGGRVDSLPSQRVTLRVASVLPRVPAGSTLAPQPRADFVPRGTHSILPVLLALLAAVLLLAPLYWWWRRRGPVAPLRPVPSPAKGEPPLERWTDAGEPRAVAASVATRLRAGIALRAPSVHRGLDTEALLALLVLERPDWPLEDVRVMLRSLDRVRFGTGPALDVLELARGAAELESRLPSGGR